MKKVLISLILVLILSFGVVFLFNNSLFIFYGDNLDQLLPFYNHLLLKIKDLSFSFWDSSIGFGSNIFVLFFNAPLGSPFLYLSLLFDNEFIPYFFYWSLLLRFILTGIFSYLWISNITKNEPARVFTTFMFTFSGWAMYWIHYNTSLDFYMYIPLILYLSEEVLKGKRQISFIIITFLAILSSLYYFYIFSWLIIFYHLIRYFSSNTNYSIKSFFDYVLKLIIPYSIAIGLAAFIVLPNISIILSSPRLLSNSLPLFSFDFSPEKIYSFFTSFLSPVLSDYDTNIYISRVLNNLVSLNYQYTSLLFPIILLPLFKTKNNRKWIYIISIFSIYLFSFVPFFNILVSGNNDKRWFIIPIVINLLSVIFVLENNKNKFDYIISSFITFIIVFSFSYYSLKNNLVQTDFREDLKLNLVISTIIIFIYAVSFYVNKSKIALIYLIVILESTYIVHSRINIHNNPKYITNNNVNFSEYYESDVYDYIKSIDNSYYRIDVHNSNANNPMNFNYPGLQFYSSVYNHSTRNILDNRFASGWNSGYSASKPLYKSLLNSKYYVTRDASTVPYGYLYLETINYDQIYVNDFQVGIGFASNNRMNINDFNLIPKPIQDIYLYQAIAGKFSSSAIDISLPTLLKSAVINDSFNLPNDDGYILFDYTGRSYTNCYLEQYKDNEVITNGIYSEYGYLLVKKSDEVDRAYISCTFMYNSNEQVPSDVYFISNSYIQNLYDNVNSFDQFKNINVSNDKVTAEIEITNDNSVAFVNIPFDKGWSLKIDGKITKIIQVNDGFIGFDIEKGNHKIELNFLPHLYIPGVLVSISSIIILIFYRSKLNKKL